MSKKYPYNAFNIMQRIYYQTNKCNERYTKVICSCPIQSVELSVTEIPTRKRLHNVHHLLEPTVFLYNIYLLIY